MGIMDLVATNVTDYARIGAWMVNDHTARDALRARIQAASSVLFNDPSVVVAWENVLVEAVRRRAAVVEGLGGATPDRAQAQHREQDEARGPDPAASLVPPGPGASADPALAAPGLASALS